MQHTIRNADFANEVDRIITKDIKFDRIIVDFPSVAGRWPGIKTKERLSFQLGKLQKLVKSDQLLPHGSITLSITGDIQREWKDWMAYEGHKYIEEVPNSLFTVYTVALVDTRDDSLFVTRRIDWTWVQTYRKVGSEFTLNHVDPIKTWPGKFANFMNGEPLDRSKLTVHSFRPPFHKGINETAEWDSWKRARELHLPENQQFLGSLSGVLVNFDTDRGNYHHHAGWVKSNVPFVTDKVFNATQDDTKASFQLNKNREFHFNMWLMQACSNEGEHVFNPFAFDGTTAVAGFLTKRKMYVIDFNKGRTDNIGRLHNDLVPLLT